MTRMVARHILAVDIGASKTLLAVRRCDQLSEGWHAGSDVSRTATPRDPAALVDWIAGRVDGLALDVPAAIGVAAPGPLDVVTGIVTRSSNLGWEGVPLGAMMTDRLGAPVIIEDDANAAALGEWRFGAGEQADPFAYLTVSSGIGGGVVVGGAIVRGVDGNAGEVGHIVLDPDGPQCACGRRGDVESFAGGTALERRARGAWPDGLTQDRVRAPRTAAEIFAAARRGDVTARGIVDDAIAAVAMALGAFAAVLEPQRFAVGGSIGLRQRGMVRKAAAMARRKVMAENGRSIDVRTAALGAESVLAGAAVLAQRRAERR